jgi:hypothetical protein
MRSGCKRWVRCALRWLPRPLWWPPGLSWVGFWLPWVAGVLFFSFFFFFFCLVCLVWPFVSSPGRPGGGWLYFSLLAMKVCFHLCQKEKRNDAESSLKPHRRDPELAGCGKERKGPEQARRNRAWTVWTPARGFSKVKAEY